MKNVALKLLKFAGWYIKMIVIVQVCLFVAMAVETYFFVDGSGGYTMLFALVIVLIFNRKSNELTKKERVRIWKNVVRTHAKKWNTELWQKNGDDMILTAIKNIKSERNNG